MNGKHFYTYIILLAVQVLFCNYLHLSQFVMLSILPVMVLLESVRCSSVKLMLEAFLMGFAVDFLSDAVLGLNVLALVPVAFARNFIVRLVFGDELFARGEDVSIARQGLMKVSIAVLMAQSLFLLIYIWADGAGTRPLWFSAARFVASLLAGTLLSIVVAQVLSPEKNSSKW